MEVSAHFGISQQAAWKFKNKIQTAMSQKDLKQLNGLVEVDEFVVGGKEKKAQGVASEKADRAIGPLK